MDQLVSITLTRYREPDWLVDETLDALADQADVAGEVILLDQNWQVDFAARVEQRSTNALIFRCLPCEERGLAFARNKGLDVAAHSLVLQIDPDAVPDTSWALNIARTLLDKQAMVVGSRIVPRWAGRPPLLAKSRVVLDQYSIFDFGAQILPVTRVVGAGIGLNKDLIPEELRFAEDFGRKDGALFGGEETDYCRRILKRGGKVFYAGHALIHHQILPERLTWSWILRRLYFAGAGRRQQGGAPAPFRKPGLWDWLLLPVILPPYVLGYLCAHTSVSKA